MIPMLHYLLVPKRKSEKITIVTITESEIIDTIETLDPNKAVGEDLIINKVLRATKQSICKHLCALFNRSLTESIFPSQWISALVFLHTR